MCQSAKSLLDKSNSNETTIANKSINQNKLESNTNDSPNNGSNTIDLSNDLNENDVEKHDDFYLYFNFNSYFKNHKFNHVNYRITIDHSADDKAQRTVIEQNDTQDLH